MYFRNLIFSAFVIAIIAGLCFSAYQSFFITPLILDAEIYEVLEPEAGNHVEAWAPADGLERDSWSFVSNFIVAFAYALILLCAMSVRPSVNVLKGCLWGIAAYLSIFVAPALGLPPEIPGMEAAQLEGRQAWWVMTVVLTALSIWLIAFHGVVHKVIAVVLIVTPHIIAAPQAEIHGFVNTDPQAIEALTGIWQLFIVQTCVANALLWLIIGGLAGFLVNRYIHPLDLLLENKH